MAIIFERERTDENDDRFTKSTVMLPRLELVTVNKFLIISSAFSEIVGVGHLHFNIERAISALFLNVNVEANTFAVRAQIDSLFALRITYFFDFDVENKFKKSATQVGIGF